MALKKDSCLQYIVLPILFLIHGGTLQAFKLISRTSLTHDQITEAAILNATAGVCKTLLEQEGGNFALLPNQLTVSSLAEACLFTDSMRTFQLSIRVISSRNAAVDIQRVFDEEYHFDDESFIRGKSLITRGLASIKANIKQGNFLSAQLKVGEIMHTLQDFYSHSNWIELGNTFAYSNLIRTDLSIDNIADSSTPTCRNCVGGNCENNILENIITEKKLTSGYFNLISSDKPEGKCSHGGSVDKTSDSEPRGGINKDGVDSEHGHLHTQAAQTAIAATTELLLDIRQAAGDADFLRLMGISRSSSSSSSSVLCLVVDISASMANVLAQLKKTTSLIINSLSKLPSVFILISFSNTGVGPLLRTTDSDIFLSQINDLSASGGGSNPEPGRSLEATWRALSEAPPSSQIFVFTDAAPTDTQLESTVLSLIETTQSGVNFFLTNVGRSSQRSNELYQSLAKASGGQAIVITEEKFSQAVDIITNSLRPSLATIFQAVRDQGTTETFSFTVDDSVKNLTVYITGSSPAFTIVSASGKSQSSETSSGSLGTIQTVGNFITVLLNSQPEKGQWRINMNSLQSYTITVIGETTIDFIYDIVEVSQNPLPGFSILESRPPADGNASLSVTLTGGSSINLTEVTLISVSGSDKVKGTIERTDSGGYLVTVTRVPEGSFFVQLKGTNESSTLSDNLFQRQSSNQLKASTISVMAQVDTDWNPGTNVTIPFTVTTTNNTGGNFTIQARNSRGFSSSFPSNVTLDAGGRAEGTVTLTAPSDTPSGIDVTLTIEVTNPGATDSNYVVLRLTVADDVADVTAPVCQVVSVNSNCSDNCTMQTWDFTASLNDGNGTGIERVATSGGLGNLTTRTQPGAEGFNVTLAFFSTSCCSEEVRLVAVDAVGNVGSCTIRSGVVQLQAPPLSLWVCVVGILLARTLSLLHLDTV